MDFKLNQRPTTMKLNNGELTITIQTDFETVPQNATYLYVKQNQLLEVTTSIKKQKVDRLISLEMKGQSAVEVKNAIESETNPQHSYWLDLLGLLGCSLTATKTTGKVQHKFNKQLVDMPLYVDYEGSQATVYWRKRTELVIKKGAIMRAEVPLNRDGKLGFSARFAEQLRSEHAAQFTNWVTTEDVVLKSINEVGLFLYFGGTNSWLVLKNDGGKTIDELTKIG